MLTRVIKWLPLGLVVTALCALSYLVVQQNYRLSANDPQIQLSEDLAASLSSGKPPPLPISIIDISTSLAPYVVIYDTSGQPVAGNGQLDGQLPRIPPVIFGYVKEHGQTRVTWQPRSGVRSAIVVTQSNAGYVLAGRSLREVELRESQLEYLVGLGWVSTLAASLIFAIILS